MTYETVKYEKKGRIVYITLNRPASLNASNEQLRSDLTAALSEFDMDEEAWVCILHGAGRCFCAGADVKQDFNRPIEERRRKMSAPHKAEGYLGLYSTTNWKPVIAAVHSYCLGGGLAIALECDLIVASEDAQFGITETKRGLSGSPVWATLQWFVPSKVSTEMLLTGDRVPASELYRLGLINRLVPVGQHLQAAEELAQQILKAPPLAVRSGVRISRYPLVGRSAEAALYCDAVQLYLTEDFEESTRAFLEKREPVYHGR